MKKIKVAVLDDYQNVTHCFANWQKLGEKIKLKIFNEYIGNNLNLSEKLYDYDVLCLMRERTPWRFNKQTSKFKTSNNKRHVECLG